MVTGQSRTIFPGNVFLCVCVNIDCTVLCLLFWEISPLLNDSTFGSLSLFFLPSSLKQVVVLTVIKTALVLSLREHNLLILLHALLLPAYMLQFHFPIPSVSSYNISHSLNVSFSPLFHISQSFLLLCFFSLFCFVPTSLLTVFTLFISCSFLLSSDFHTPILKALHTLQYTFLWPFFGG